jgi:hypothetical protein
MKTDSSTTWKLSCLLISKLRDSIPRYMLKISQETVKKIPRLASTSRDSDLCVLGGAHAFLKVSWVILICS